MSASRLALSFRIFRHGQLIREDRLTQGVIKIGKAPSAHLRIDDESVGRMHAVVEVSRGEVSLIDLGSIRGTHVNGKKINKARLVSGDVVTLGEIRLELTIGEAEPAGAGPPTPPEAAPRRAPATGTAPAIATGGAVAGVATPEVPLAGPATPVAAPAAAIAGPAAPRPVGPAELPVGATLIDRASAEPLEPATGRGGARAVEVAAMLGDTIVGMKHCVDPRSGRVRPATWAVLAGGAACALASAIAFLAALHNAAANHDRREVWTSVEHKPAYAFRPVMLGPAVDGVAFGGLAFGLVGLTLGLARLRRERISPYFRIGTAPGVELALDSAPLAAFPLVAPSGDGFVFNYGAGIDGELILDGTATPLAELAAAGRSRPSASVAGAIEVALPPSGRIRARSGQTTFAISAIAPPRRHARPLLASLDRRTLGYVAGSLAVHLVVLAVLDGAPPEVEGANLDGAMLEPLTGRIHGTEHVEPPPPPATVLDRGDGGNPGSAAAMALPAGASGNPDAARADGHLRVARTAEAPELSREAEIALATRAGILGSERLADVIQVLGATADYASGFDDTSSNGLRGADGDGRGSFGAALRGPGPGGGCPAEPCGTIGAGSYRTIHDGDRAGDGWRGRWHDGIAARDHHAVLPVIGQPVAACDTCLDKAIIRRYLRRHIDEIAYCYEKQLLANHSLGGDLTVAFFIGASGVVQRSSGSGFDREVASCVAGVIAAIQFPKPGDAGVQVSYPFHFRPTGP